MYACHSHWTHTQYLTDCVSTVSAADSRHTRWSRKTADYVLRRKRTKFLPLWSSSQEQPSVWSTGCHSKTVGQERSFWSCLSATLVRRCVKRRSTSRVQGVPSTRPCLRPCTRSFMACTDRVHHDTMHTRHCKSWQQKFVGRLLLKSNHSFSPNRLVYVFGSRDLLGHNVGHVIAHAQLTLWTILLNLIERERVWEKRCGLWYACEVACGRGRSDVVSSRIYTYNHTYSLASYVGP